MGFCRKSGVGFLEVFMGVLWEFCRNSGGIFWEFCRNSGGIFWEFLGVAPLLQLFLILPFILFIS
jgi:hypothetical protein